jgi:hypothetical protein
MSEAHGSQVAQLSSAAAALAAQEGADICIAVEEQSLLLVRWLGYLHNFHQTGTANSLLHAVSSSIRETAACLSLGLVRPALFSLRSEIDLLLAWLFFKDHPVEWRLVNRTGEGFWMKKEILEYLAGHYIGSKQRLSLLKQIKKRKEDEPYRLLSAHVHGQSEAVLPIVADLKDSISSAHDVIAATAVCFEVSEYISDVLLSVYSADWQALPIEITASVLGRFASDPQKTEFFSY